MSTTHVASLTKQRGPLQAMQQGTVLLKYSESQAQSQATQRSPSKNWCHLGASSKVAAFLEKVGTSTVASLRSQLGGCSNACLDWYM